MEAHILVFNSSTEDDFFFLLNANIKIGKQKTAPLAPLTLLSPDFLGSQNVVYCENR